MPDQRQRDLTMRFLAEPTDVNFGGKVHGGAVMKWIDQAAYAAAVGWCGTYAVTVPAWTPASEADRRLADYAGKVMELGKGIEETIARALAQ